MLNFEGSCLFHVVCFISVAIIRVASHKKHVACLKATVMLNGGVYHHYYTYCLWHTIAYCNDSNGGCCNRWVKLIMTWDLSNYDSRGHCNGWVKLLMAGDVQLWQQRALQWMGQASHGRRCPIMTAEGTAIDGSSFSWQETCPIMTAAGTAIDGSSFSWQVTCPSITAEGTAIDGSSFSWQETCASMTAEGTLINGSSISWRETCPSMTAEGTLINGSSISWQET